MDYIRDRKSNISFSLHDSRILQIEINEDKLSLNMDRIFQYTDNEEKWYKGIIEFTNIDKEECNIMVFNAPYGYNEVKSFSGKELSFDEFKERYPNAEFEIVTEGYCGYDIIHFLRREMLDFTAFPVFFVSNLLLVQRKKYYFNRATVSRNCSIVL